MTNKSVLIFGLAAALVFGGSAYWLLFGDETAVAIPPADIQDINTDTIADKWQWSSFANTKPATENSDGGKSAPTSAVPQEVVGIYRILQSVKLDENGRVAPDQTLKEALEEGFDKLGPNLGTKELSELQNLIRVGLPGPAGEEVAHLLGNYYRFRLVEVEFNRQLETQLPMAHWGAEAALNRPGENQLSAVNHHKELVQLRRNFLGEEIADKLFAVEDTQASHMFAAIAIQQDPNLTPEEKQTKQEALQEQLNERQLALGQLKPEEVAAEKVRRLREQGATGADIYSTRKSMLGAERANELAVADREEADWQSNFNGFWQARRYVMQADFEEAERERQIEQLLDQYFSPEERERARATSFDWQARDPK